MNHLLFSPDGTRFIWRNPQYVLAWAWRPSHDENSHVYGDRTDHVEIVGPDVMTVSGYCCYLPDTR